MVGGYAERHHVSDPHYYVPGRYLDAFGRECFPEFSLGVFRVDLSQALSLIVLQKYRQQNILLWSDIACVPLCLLAKVRTYRIKQITRWREGM